MGVMLSLDRQRPARSRRRQGQHKRHPGDQASAAARGYDGPVTAGLLTRLARTVRARKGPRLAAPPAAGAARDGTPRNRSATDESAPAA